MVAKSACLFGRPPASVTRRNALFAGASFAAFPFASHADGQISLVTLQKARLSYGQRVLALADASTEKVLEEQNAIKLYMSAVSRAKGMKADPRKSPANDIIVLAKVRNLVLDLRPQT